MEILEILRNIFPKFIRNYGTRSVLVPKQIFSNFSSGTKISIHKTALVPLRSDKIGSSRKDLGATLEPAIFFILSINLLKSILKCFKNSKKNFFNFWNTRKRILKKIKGDFCTKKNWIHFKTILRFYSSLRKITNKFGKTFRKF